MNRSCCRRIGAKDAGAKDAGAIDLVARCMPGGPPQEKNLVALATPGVSNVATIL